MKKVNIFKRLSSVMIAVLIVILPFYTAKIDAVKAVTYYTDENGRYYIYNDNYFKYRVYPEKEFVIADGYDDMRTAARAINHFNGLKSRIDGYPVRFIGGHAFSYAPLKEITIPTSVLGILGGSIQGGAFSETELTSITIPYSVTEIGSMAFNSCEKLQSIYILNPECEIQNPMILLPKTTICNNKDGFTGIIYGYKDSTAQEYAEKCGYNFVDITTGDAIVTSVPSTSVITTTTTKTTPITTTTKAIKTTTITKATTTTKSIKTTTTPKTTTTTKTIKTTTTSKTTKNISTTTTVTAGAVAGFSYPLNGLDPKNSPVKPTISVDCVEISIDEAKQNPVQNVGVTIEGADKKYCSTGFHILFDDRLTVKAARSGNYVKMGEAVSNLSAFLSHLQAKNALFVCASGSGDYGLNGTYCKIPFIIPADCKEGDVYPINIAYLGNDLFTNSNNDVSGKLMQAWVFTHGIKQGYIRIKGDTEKPIPSISIPDVYTKSTATIPAYQPSNVKGDANNDGVFNIADLVMTQKWLLGNGSLTAWENADVYKDNRIDVFDMVILRRMMIEKIPATDKGIISTYAEVKTVPDYYTNDETDWHGDSLPFSASQIKSIKIIDVYDNGTKVARSNIDDKLINFGGLTPANIYSSSNKDFEYNVQIYYGDLPLRDKNGLPVCIKAYIGLKGDISLDNKLDSIDASDILRIYSSYAMGVSVNIFTSNPIVTNSQDPLNELARYLADVNRDGIIDATDASEILRTYSQAIGK